MVMVEDQRATRFQWNSNYHHKEIMEHLTQILLRDLFAILGEECWGVVGGEGTGSVILLHIGVRTLRAKPVRNPYLSDFVRRYDSAYTLRIMCPWRIDSPTEVVAGSHMPNSNDGPMVKGFESICGKTVTSVSCSAPAFDLILKFDNLYSLVIQCSSIGWDSKKCYSFGTPAGHYVVALDGKIVFEPVH